MAKERALIQVSEFIRASCVEGVDTRSRGWRTWCKMCGVDGSSCVESNSRSAVAYRSLRCARSRGEAPTGQPAPSRFYIDLHLLSASSPCSTSPPYPDHGGAVTRRDPQGHREEVRIPTTRLCEDISFIHLLFLPRPPLSGRIASAPRCNSLASLSLPSCPPFPAREALGSRHRNHPAFESPCCTSAFFSSFLRPLRSSFSEPLLGHPLVFRHLVISPLTQLLSPPPPAASYP